MTDKITLWAECDHPVTKLFDKNPELKAAFEKQAGVSLKIETERGRMDMSYEVEDYGHGLSIRQAIDTLRGEIVTTIPADRMEATLRKHKVIQ